jgi:hypothetical protein
LREPQRACSYRYTYCYQQVDTPFLLFCISSSGTKSLRTQHPERRARGPVSKSASSLNRYFFTKKWWLSLFFSSPQARHIGRHPSCAEKCLLELRMGKWRRAPHELVCIVLRWLARVISSPAAPCWRDRGSHVSVVVRHRNSVSLRYDFYNFKGMLICTTTERERKSSRQDVGFPRQRFKRGEQCDRSGRTCRLKVHRGDEN